MQVQVPVIVKDPVVTQYADVDPTEQVTVDADVFLDGPVSPRVAVLDFEPRVGTLAAPARFIPPKARARRGAYEVPHPVRTGDPAVDRIATSVSVFGAVHKTIEMFEEPDALGRTVSWAFGTPQLFVVPRAGEMANAYYERESHSLQFFFFADPTRPGGLVHTANSQDIVAHETAHALLDGIAPDLYSAISPQSLAIHEAVADLASLLVSLRCRQLTRRVLRDTGGRIDDSNAFSGLAEQFAMALDPERHYLRNLNNATRVDDVPSDRPHDLSTVISGAFYSVLVETYEDVRAHYAAKSMPDPAVIPAREAEHAQHVATPAPRGRAAGAWADAAGVDVRALFVAAERIKRTLLRGLDYLPPGDVNFADLARAVLASDEASHPDSPAFRGWLVREFDDRGITHDPDDLDVDTNFAHEALHGVDIPELIASDFVAYTFAERNRAWLHIPPDTPFEVRPRLDVSKLYWHRDGERTVREVLFKVSWSQIEESRSGGGLPSQRRYRAGTTLAIGLDRATPYVRAMLTSSRLPADRIATDALLKALIESEQLHVTTTVHTGPPLLQGAVEADVASGVLRIHGMARTLHTTGRPR